jgi:hypothetical protein
MPAALLASNHGESKPVIQPHGRSLLDIARALFRPCAIG